MTDSIERSPKGENHLNNGMCRNCDVKMVETTKVVDTFHLQPSSPRKCCCCDPGEVIYSGKTCNATFFDGDDDVWGQGEEDDYPGPGQYTPTNHTFDGPKYSIREKNHIEHQDTTPGPGKYTPTDHTFDSPTKIFHRPMNSKVVKEESPGPGKYDLPDHTFDSPKKTIGRRIKGPRKENYPGPGQYHLRKGNDGLKYSIRERIHRKEPDITPGPGQYNVNSSTFDVPTHIIHAPVQSRRSRRAETRGSCRYAKCSSIAKDSGVTKVCQEHNCKGKCILGRKYTHERTVNKSTTKGVECKEESKCRDPKVFITEKLVHEIVMEDDKTGVETKVVLEKETPEKEVGKQKITPIQYMSESDLIKELAL